MAVDVISILDRYGIEYVEKGPNVKKGNINIACPFCGDDPSHHLGINLNSGKWGCWRNSKHRGVKLGWLFAALLKIPLVEAKEIAEEGGDPIVDADRFTRAINALKAPKVLPAAPSSSKQRIKLPQGCFGISRDQPLSERAYNYLKGRGFTSWQVELLAEKYKLQFCAWGEYKDRIIIPVYHHSVLSTFVGRSIYKNSILRYKAQPANEALRPVKECVYNVDAIRKRSAKRLYIVEGPFDVLKLDQYAAPRREAVVGLFSKSLEDEQAGILSECCKNVEEVVLLLDAHETFSSMEVSSRLRVVVRKRIAVLECAKFGADDPGSMTPEQCNELLNYRIKRA